MGGGAAGVGLWRLARVDRDYAALFSGEVRHAMAARELQVAFKRQVQEWKNVLLRAADPADRATYVGAFQREGSAVRRQGAALVREVRDPAARALTRQFLQAHASLELRYEQALELYLAGGGRDPRAADRLVRGLDRAPTALLDSVVAHLEARTRRAVDAEHARLGRDRVVLAVATLALFALTFVALAAVVRRITRPLRHLRRSAEAIATGELRPVEADAAAREAAEGGAEVLALGEAFATMADGLRTLVRDVRRHAESTGREAAGVAAGAAQMHAAAGEATRAASDIATAAARQADGLRRSSGIASTVDAAVASVLAAASDAEAATRVVERAARRGAEAGADARVRLGAIDASARDVQATLAELRDRAVDVGELTRELDEMARQSELLAVSASIEAARAGAQGTGFAVVAREMRVLAGAGAGAHERIRGMADDMRTALRATDERLGRMRDAVGAGEQAVDAADVALASLIEAAGASRAAAGRITAAAEAQRADAATLAGAVLAVSGDADAVAALAEALRRQAEEQAAAARDAAAAGRALSERADALEVATMRFVV